MDEQYNIVHFEFAQAELPKFNERSGDGSRIDFGTNNNYPSFLNDLYRQSAKHGAIIKGKATYIYGSGFTGLSSVMANKYDSWNDTLKKCILDDEKYGGYALQIVWNKLGKIANVYHIKFHKVRTNYDNSKFWVKDEWDINKVIAYKQKTKERPYDAFDPSNPVGTQILYVKQECDQNDVYPLPSYFQALNYINADVLVGQHILGMAQDGFVASKLINFNNGVPATEQAKEAIEKAVAKKFTGSDGKRFMLSFNKNAESQVTITDLGSTQLTKEDFTNINNLIQQEIYAAHQITSPMLFGIKTEGQLGGRGELATAYEIFKNTYVNERQREHEGIFNKLLNLAGIMGEHKITPVEPLGVEIPQTIIEGLPKKYFLDKLGINPEDYPELQGTIMGQPQPVANEILKSLTGQQWRQLNRTVRDYSKGRITRPMASTILKTTYGLSDEQVIDFIGEESEFQQFHDDSLIPYFAEFGEQRENFIIVKQSDFKRETFDMQFAEQVELDKLSTNVLNLISKDKRITADVLSTVTKKPVEVINKVLADLKEQGYLTENNGIRELTKPIREITDTKPTTTQVLIRYTYEGPKDDRNRPFCARLLELDKMYSREDIETISQRVGYSVWDRRGGWWTQPDGTASPSCRHSWKTNIVLKKK